MSDDDIDDLIASFVVEGYRFKVITTHVDVGNPDQVNIIRAGGIFHTDFYLTVPYITHETLVEKGFMDIFIGMLQDAAPSMIENLAG